MATHHEIEELAAVLENSLGASFNPQGYALYRDLILLLAEGQPVSSERVASVLGLAREEALELLRQRPSLEWDDDGNIVGASLATAGFAGSAVMFGAYAAGMATVLMSVALSAALVKGAVTQWFHKLLPYVHGLGGGLLVLAGLYLIWYQGRYLPLVFAGF